MEFYYYSNGQKLGPLSSKEVREFASNGTIVPDTRLELDDGRLILARNVRGLVFGEPPTQKFEPPVVPQAPAPGPVMMPTPIVIPVPVAVPVPVGVPAPAAASSETPEDTSDNSSEGNPRKSFRKKNTSGAGLLKTKNLIIAGVIFSVAVAAVVWLLQPSAADLRVRGLVLALNYQNAEQVKRGKNADEAFQLFEKAAKRGDVEALFYLGMCYRTGLGVKEDAYEALELITKAAEKGCPEANEALAECYESGELTVKDEEKSKEFARNAVRLYEAKAKALRAQAKDGNARAQFELGMLYVQGSGVQRDIMEAMKWWRAADKNHQVLPKRVRDTLKMYEDSKKGDAVAQVGFGKELVYSDKVQEGVDLILESALQGNAEAQCFLGSSSLIKDIKSPGGKSRLEWLTQAAASGYAEAQCELGEKYLLGLDGFPHSDAKAEKWLLAAAAQKYKESYFLLGLLYRYDNPEEAKKWFLKDGRETALECIQEMKYD